MSVINTALVSRQSGDETIKESYIVTEFIKIIFRFVFNNKNNCRYKKVTYIMARHGAENLAEILPSANKRRLKCYENTFVLLLLIALMMFRSLFCLKIH